MQEQKQQQDSNSNSNINGDLVSSATISSTEFSYQEQILNSPNHHHFPDDGSLLNHYTSIFSPLMSPLQSAMDHSPSSLSLTTSSQSGIDDNDISVTEQQLYLERLSLQYREMEDRYNLCFSHLHDAVQEVKNLRHEISRLRKANTDLAKQLNPVPSSNPFPNSLSVMNDFRRLNLSSTDVESSSPTSVLRYEQQQILQTQPRRTSLPKNISIRSNGYLNTAAAASISISTNGSLSSAVPLLGPQRVRVPTTIRLGRQETEEALELEAYGQGMFKTELCNKWEETGACPYADHCQFAHGIGELRPVIRHPRYKTEVCRMILAGEDCPYGHRCHFRHALSQSDLSFLGQPSSS